MDFQSKLEQELSEVSGQVVSTGSVLDRILSAIKSALSGIDVSLVPREEVAGVVGEAYDKFILPIDLPGPDMFLDPLLRQVAVNSALRLYDQLAKQ